MGGYPHPLSGLGSLMGDQQLGQSQAPMYAQQANYWPSGHTMAASCSVAASPSTANFVGQPSKPKGTSMFTEVARDVKSFLLEHRGTIYFIAIALIIDHLFFKDAFRHRIQGMADKMIAKVEQKIEQ